MPAADMVPVGLCFRLNLGSAGGEISRRVRT